MNLIYNLFRNRFALLLRPLIVVVMPLMLVTISCDILEEDPVDFFSEENFYNTEVDAEAAITAAYRPLAASPSPDNGVYNDCIWYLGDLASDNTTTGPTDSDLERAQIDKFTFNATNDVFLRMWSAAYDGINKSNIVLSKIPSISFKDESRKNQIIGEANFLRALYYFNLVRLYGDVPLLDEAFTGLDQNQKPLQSSVADIYEFIIADLEAAEKALPAKWALGDVGRATSGAATSLLAKVYLTKKDWPMALAKSQQVINSGIYALFPNYREVFLSSQSLEPEHNENGIESIFEVQMRSNQSLRNRLALVLAPADAFIINGGRSSGNGNYVPTNEFYNLYPKSDERKDWNFLTSYVDTDGDTILVQPHYSKYRDPGAGSSSSSNNYYVLRYADILLMYAEAENEISGPTAAAYDAFNKVHTRAGLSPLSTGLTKEQFKDSVLLERNLEFPWEGHRWFDLVRTNRLITALQAQGIDVKPFQTLYPIPQSELDLNSNLEQNEGY